MKGSLRFVVLFLAISLGLLTIVIEPSEGHFSGGFAKVAGNYRIQFTAEPPIPAPSSIVSLLFSIQDLNGNNLDNINASVRIVERNSIIREFPKKRYPSGDFVLNHVFNKEGTFQIVVEVSEGKGSIKADFSLAVVSETLAFVLTHGVLLTLGLMLGIVALILLRGKGREPDQPASTVRLIRKSSLS